MHVLILYINLPALDMSAVDKGIIILMYVTNQSTSFGPGKNSLDLKL